MNENIDLRKILKDCPKGWPLYSSVFGDAKFLEVDNNYVSIGRVGKIIQLTSDGRMFSCSEGECIIFPSREQRDWSKFTAPWYKKEKFDPKTLKAFDKVLVRDHHSRKWIADFYSHKSDNMEYPYRCISEAYTYCIPYNEETKHLPGTTKQAPEYYRYWEDEYEN